VTQNDIQSGVLMSVITCKTVWIFVVCVLDF